MNSKNVKQLKLETAERLLRVTNKMLYGRKHPRDYGTGELLYMSEIEVIREVGGNKGICLTVLADILGVRKATLSPIVNKLEKKRYLTKKSSADNAKTKQLFVTARGSKAITGMAKYANKFDEYMDNATKSQLASYVDFLDRVESFIDDVDHDLR